MLVQKGSFIVPFNCYDYNAYPQCSLREDYNNGINSDKIRFLLAERAQGDFEQYITDLIFEVKNNNMSIGHFDYALAANLVMISYTLYVLDEYFDGFVHGDLGPRNILFTIVEKSDSNWHYKIKFNDGNVHDYYISAQIGTIPKLWDFATTYINLSKLPPESVNEFNYLGGKYNQLSKFKEDLSILIGKIVELIDGLNSSLMPVFNEILSESQTLNNRAINEKFLTSNIILYHFGSKLGAGDIEYSFSN